MDEQIQGILEFWFGEPPEGDERPTGQELWFSKSARVDRQIEKKFGKLMTKALAGELSSWTGTAEGRLAVILLLTTFRRRAFRETPDAYRGEEEALAICFDGLDEDMHRQLDPHRRAFFLMPCVYAEDPDAQLAGVEEFQALVEEAAPDKREICEEFLRRAERSRDVVERFERFPQRNNVLNRSSTPEESAFLQHSGSL